MKKKVVIIGGGNGASFCINALKAHIQFFDISAVIPMSDSGGSSGILRKEFKTLPPGDILRAVLAMSKYDYKLLKQIFYKNRFEGVGKLNKHDLGNIFLVLGSKYAKDYLKIIKALSQSLEVVGDVLPVSLSSSNLVAKLSNKKILKGEDKIDKPNCSRKLKIEDVWLEPKIKALPQVLKKIESADYIIFSVGSLYTSLVPCLLTKGIKKSIKKTKAKIVNIVQASFEGDGELGPTNLKERVEVLEKYLLRSVDILIYNNVKLNERQKKKYKDKNWIELDKNYKKLKNKKIIGVDFESSEGGVSVDKLSKILKRVLK